MSKDVVNRKSYEKVGLVYNAIVHREKEIFVERVLQREGDINCKSSQGSNKTPHLLDIARDLNWGYFSLLLDYGADFTYKDEESRTAVHIFIQKMTDCDYPDVLFDKVDLALAAHVKLNNPSNPIDNNGISHFHAACISRNSLYVKFFLENGVDVNQTVNADSPYFPQYTPLHFAVKYTNPEIVEILLKHGANVHAINAFGFSPLHLVIKKRIAYDYDHNVEGKYEQILSISSKFLMNYDSNDSINATDDFGFCKFHVACTYHDVTLVENALERIENINKPVNVDSPVGPGYTALHFASFSTADVFKLLLDKGANAEAKNAFGETPLDFCSQNYTAKDIHSILSTKEEWKSIILSDNKTKLIDVASAMENGDKFVRFLNSKKSALHSTVPHDSFLWPGYTLLHLAVVIAGGTSITYFNYEQRDDDVVRACLSQGADVTAKDAKGSTALHLAFILKKRYAIKSILDHHDKPANPANKDNLSHFHIACAVDHRKSVENFLSIGVDVNSPILATFEGQNFLVGTQRRRVYIYPGSTALHICVAVGESDELAKMLLEYGADVNAQDVNGFTAVHRLFSSRSGRTFEWLISAENLKNVTAPCGLTHLHVACYLGNEAAVEKLLTLGADINAQLTYECDVRVEDYNNRRYMDFEDLYNDPRKPLAFLSKCSGYTPLHFTWLSKRKLVSLLIERNADVFAKDRKKNFPLQTFLHKFDESFAMNNRSNDRDMYLRVISHNIAIKTYLKEEYGITELHIVCRLADVNLAEQLIKLGANVNAQVNSKSAIWQGYTALHCAISKRFREYCYPQLIDNLEEIVRVLTMYGADALLTDKNDNTPFDLWCTNDESYSIIEKFSTTVSFFTYLFNNVKNFDGKTVGNHGLSLFHIACMTANVAVVEKFLRQGGDVNQAISYFSRFCPSSTALHLVIKRYCKSCAQTLKLGFSDKVFFKLVDMLLKSDANVNATDAFGSTPLHEAVGGAKLRPTLIQKLIRNGADVHIKNVRCNTAFKLLLDCGDATWEEIDIFLKAGCNFNTYHPTSEEGYIALFLQGIESTNIITKNKLIYPIIDNPNIIEIDESERSALHNVVSIRSYKKETNQWSHGYMVYESPTPTIVKV